MRSLLQAVPGPVERGARLRGASARTAISACVRHRERAEVERQARGHDLVHHLARVSERRLSKTAARACTRRSIAGRCVRRRARELGAG